MSNLLEFLNMEESKEQLAKLTVAQRVKYATIFQWYGITDPKEAAEKAMEKCSEEAVGKRHEEGNNSFESELASIAALKKVAELTDEEAERLDEEVFTKASISDDLKQKITTAIRENGTEDAIIDILEAIHDNWMGNHGDNFQKSGRDKDYQFVDLKLMPFGDDGATADLIFLRPILEECGIEIDMESLEKRFNELQVEFIKEKGLTSEEALCEYLSNGADSNKALSGLVAATGETIDDILKSKPEVVKHMAEQVMSKLPENAKFAADNLVPELMEEFSEAIDAAGEEIIEDNMKDREEKQNEENR